VKAGADKMQKVYEDGTVSEPEEVEAEDLQEWMTPQEHSALRSEFWVMAFLVAVMLFCVFAEPLMDVFMAMLGVR